MKKIISFIILSTFLCSTLSLFSSCTNNKNSKINIPKGAKEFKVEDYGAKGDGETDDAVAVADTIQAAISSKKPAVVRFKKDATYNVLTSKLNSEGLNSAFIINKAKDLVIMGDNTTIMIKVPLKFMHIVDSENVSICGFNFDYIVKPYTVSKVKEVNVKEKYAIINSAKSLEIEGVWSAPPGDFFGLPLLTGRHHMFISKIEKLDSNNNYKLYFTRPEASLLDRLYLLSVEKPDFLTPMPNVAHTIGEAFTFNDNNNLTMADCEVWSAPQFVFNIRGNDGILDFNNVNIRPKPGTDEKMVAWRDGYHCKDNRAKMNWYNCITTGVHDDTYNISSTLLTVTKVISDTEFQMTCTENNGAYYKLRPGDELTAFNVETGELVGNTKIAEVVRQSGAFNVIRVEQPMKNLVETQVKVAINTMCAPKTEITNCTIDGSVRFRGEMTVKNTAFKLLYMWIQNETIFEGPIPKNMLFNNCKFEGYTKNGNIMSIKTVQNEIGVPQYYCDNIVFEKCIINKDQVEIGDNCKVTFKE